MRKTINLKFYNTLYQILRISQDLLEQYQGFLVFGFLLSFFTNAKCPKPVCVVRKPNHRRQFKDILA